MEKAIIQSQAWAATPAASASICLQRQQIRAEADVIPKGDWEKTWNTMLVVIR